MDKNKKDAEDYTKPRNPSTGKVYSGSLGPDGRRYLSADSTSRATEDAGRMAGKTKDKAYQMSYINKGRKASESMQADKKDAKAAALRIMKKRDEFKKKNPKGLFDYEYPSSPQDIKEYKASRKRYR
jgi:hypothetical protein